jgi:hypothetical protein
MPKPNGCILRFSFDLMRKAESTSETQSFLTKPRGHTAICDKLHNVLSVRFQIRIQILGMCGRHRLNDCDKPRDDWTFKRPEFDCCFTFSQTRFVRYE